MDDLYGGTRRLMSFVRARSMGLELIESKIAANTEYNELLVAELRKGDERFRVAGTIIGKTPRIVEIDHLFVDAAISGHLLIVRMVAIDRYTNTPCRCDFIRGFGDSTWQRRVTFFTGTPGHIDCCTGGTQSQSNALARAPAGTGYNRHRTLRICRHVSPVLKINTYPTTCDVCGQGDYHAY